MNKKIIIGIVAVLIVGLGGWKIYTDQVSGSVKETQASTSEQSSSENKDSDDKNSDEKTKDDKDEDSNKEVKEDKDNRSASKSENSNDSTQQNKDSNSIISKDNKNKNDKEENKKDTKKDSDKSSNNNIKIPYNVSSTGMQISKIKSYSGKFVENGSDKEVSNILALEVKNTSKKDLQYGQIKLKINNKKTATFDLTNLPSGKTVTVIESTGSISYNSKDIYKYEDSYYGVVNSLPMNKDKIKVTTENTSITIENISKKDLGTVYVYYKNKKGSSYLGGITYRVKFENVDEGQVMSSETKHFSKSNSEIVMVDTEK